MNAKQSIRALTIGVSLLLPVGVGLVSRPRPVAAQAPDGAGAQKALDVLKKNCAGSGCHGGADAYSFDVARPESLLKAHMVVPKNSAGSELFRRIETGNMPLGGYEGKKGAKLPDDQIQAVKAWIDAGAPDPGKVAAPAEPKRAFVAEKTVLQAIIRDLQAAHDRDRPYLRYYSLVNLANNSGEVPAAQLQLYRTALSKLVNHLSWERDIHGPHAIDAQKLILRIDLRHYAWNEKIWAGIIAAYPYGLKPRHLEGEIRQIHALSGVDLPYIRVDWFVANASIPPLYHDILQLPKTVQELEHKLGVNVAQNLQQERALRGGLRNSGVSRNNRAVERHPSLYGAYWKSFDFAGNRADQNIFRDPLNFKEDGGEFVFHLPNGLQGYLISDASGKRLDAAPVEIVRDKTNLDDPVVRNGRSCIGCHFKGMRRFQDDIGNLVKTQLKAHFDLEKAEALYKGQKELDRQMERDEQQFLAALKVTGSPEPVGASEEPVSLLGQRHEGALTVAQAAADLYIADVRQFQQLLARAGALEKLGFAQLQGPNGGIKRDAWEEYFGLVVEELRLGEFLKPHAAVHRVAEAEHRDGRQTVAFGPLQGPRELVGPVRQGLVFFLNQSDQVRVITGRADYNLKGTLLVKGQNQVTVQLGDPARGILEEATGSPEDAQFVAQQLANKINFKISGQWLPNTTEVPAAAVAGGAPGHPAPPALDPVQQIVHAVGNAGPVRLTLSVDRGPGGTYKGGEDIGISFRADRDCFVTLYNIDNAGHVVQLFPNEHQPNHRVRANQVVSLVNPQNGESLITVDPKGTFGLETVLAIATLDGAALPVQPRFTDAGASITEFRSKTLKVKQLPANGATAVAAPIAGASTAVIRFMTTR